MKEKEKRKYSKEWLTEKELKELFNCEDISNKYILIMKTLYYGGFRVSEVLKFRAGDLVKEDENCYLIIHTQKNDKLNEEKQPILCNLYSELKRYCNDKKIGAHDFIISSQMRKTMSRQRVWQIARESAKKAGIDKKITTHTFRRSIIMHLLDKGMHQVEVSKFVRHSSLYSIASYVKLSKKTISEKYKQKVQYIGGN